VRNRLAAVLATDFGAVLEAATFESSGLRTRRFRGSFCSLVCIALLLFFEDFAAEALVAIRADLREARPRLLVALRLAAAAFLEVVLDALFYAFSVTQHLRAELPRPCSMFHGNPIGAIHAADGFGL